jgi:hypothetical protein
MLADAARASSLRSTGKSRCCRRGVRRSTLAAGFVPVGAEVLFAPA